MTDEDGDAGSAAEAVLVARLARCAAELYRRVPVQGAGVSAQAEELAHAADLDLLAATLDAGADLDLDSVLRPQDVRAVCQVLIDVRRNPNSLSPAEVQIAREQFPEVEAEGLEPLERLIGYYTTLLRPS